MIRLLETYLISSFKLATALDSAEFIPLASFFRRKGGRGEKGRAGRVRGKPRGQEGLGVTPASCYLMLFFHSELLQAAPARPTAALGSHRYAPTGLLLLTTFYGDKPRRVVAATPKSHQFGPQFDGSIMRREN